MSHIKIHSSITIMLVLMLTACSSPTPLLPTATPTLTATPEPTATATATVTPTETPVPTATLDLKATSAASTKEARLLQQQAQKTATAVAALATQTAEDALFAQLTQDGAITFKKGSLYEIGDFEQSWAQRNWYQWWPFDYNLADFVISTHIEWESAQSSDLANGGCGFVVRIKDENNHVVVFLTTANSAELGQVSVQGYQDMNRRASWVNYDLKKVNDTKGSADLVIAAEKEFITAYVDGVKAYKWAVARTAAGDMGYTILSGTNKDFGTYCYMTDTRIWELVKE